MAIPPEEPTQRIPVTPPPAGRPPVHEREVVYETGPDPIAVLADRLRSLRTAVALLGLVSAAALGVGIWALLEAREDNTGGPDRRGASTERVADLENRVDRLQDRTEDAASADDVASAEDLTRLRERQAELEGRIEDAERAGEGEQQDGASAEDLQALQTDIQELSAGVEALEQRVDQVEQEAEANAEQP